MGQVPLQVELIEQLLGPVETHGFILPVARGTNGPFIMMVLIYI
jgi:hypothetical protein